MVKILQGIAVVLVAILLFALSQGVKAQSVDSKEYKMQMMEIVEIIGDAVEVYKGTCLLAPNGLMAMKQDEGNRVVLCKVFQVDAETFYVVVYNDDKSFQRVIKRTEKGQELVWKVAKVGHEV